MDLNALRTRRHLALVEWDAAKAGERMATLRGRIAKGEVRLAADPGSRPIQTRLATLALDLKKLETSYDIPAEVCDWGFHIAESLTKRGLPAGSSLAIRIPGIITLEVALEDANNPPFYARPI